MPGIILSDTSAGVSELKKIRWQPSVPERSILLPFLTGISLYSAVSLLSELYERMPDALDDQEQVKLVTERSSHPLHDVDLDGYL